MIEIRLPPSYQLFRNVRERTSLTTKIRHFQVHQGKREPLVDLLHLPRISVLVTDYAIATEILLIKSRK